MSHLFLFSNVIAAMIGAGALVLLFLAYIHSKKKPILYTFLLFTTATADYLLFIIATYFYQILMVDTAYGFRAIQAVGILLTGILILGIPLLYRYISGLTYSKNERLLFTLLSVLGSVPFLAAVLSDASENLSGILRLVQLSAEFIALAYAAVHALVYLKSIRSRIRRRLVRVVAPVHLLVMAIMIAYNFFFSAELLEFGYILFYLSWAVLLLRHALLLLPFHPPGKRNVDVFCKNYGISRREKEIVQLVLDGFSNQKIADRLFISPRTVDTHLSNIYRKCGVEGRFGLIKQTKIT